MNIPPPADLLALLQQKDRHRYWRSLDDERVCLLCHRLFTGRNVIVIEGPDGEWKIQCPTPDCLSTPRDWFFHGSVQGSPRASPEGGPRKVEIDLNFG